MKGLVILIFVVVFLWLVWPTVSRWLKRKAAEKVDDYVRRQMGFPPRDKKKGSRQESFAQGGGRGGNRQRERRNPFGPERYSREPLIPKEYAEDVEFVETKNYSSTEERIHRESDGQIYHESQISDVEWTEIKKSRTK